MRIINRCTLKYFLLIISFFTIAMPSSISYCFAPNFLTISKKNIMRNLFNTAALAIIVIATCISCAKEKDLFFNNAAGGNVKVMNNKTYAPVNLNEKDTPYVSNNGFKGLDTPYVAGKPMDTPYVASNGYKGLDTPYVTTKVLDTPYVITNLLDTPYVKN
jgi:hypothetical protein